ncbi:hypothetical protein JZU46_02065 [bacterium]|jgi:hypothetical protein|nr:hypothetical protein [bacterium]
MEHCLNLLKIAEKVKPEKVNKGSFYNNLIAAFRGADTLTARERAATIKVIEMESKKAVSHLRAINTHKSKQPSSN